MNLPAIKNLEYHLGMYSTKAGFTAAQLATNMAAFGWDVTTWSEVHVMAILTGRARLTDSEKEFVTLYLLQRFEDYNSS